MNASARILSLPFGFPLASDDDQEAEDEDDCDAGTIWKGNTLQLQQFYLYINKKSGGDPLEHVTNGLSDNKVETKSSPVLRLS